MLRTMRIAALTLVVMTTTASAAPALVSQSDLYPGIHREVWVDSAIPARIHLIRIDLTSAEIAVYATKESDSGIKTSQLSDRLNAQVAINGGPFQVSGFRPRGLAVGDGTAWTMTADTDQMAVLHFRRDGERTKAAILPPETPVELGTLPLGTQGVISGRPLLVRNGNVESPTFDCNDTLTFPCTRGPRTAVALSADGNTMWLSVVNGWQAASAGLTATEFAAFLRARGAYNAIAFDGGASSTLVVNGALGNTPSDGVERTVANHLAIKYGALPKGEMVGFICNTADVPACGQDPSLRVTGARVTLDDDRFMTPADGYFGFAGITPRLACITVKKLGYLTKVQCEPVKSGVRVYNSVIMEEGKDPPDAGVPDGGEDVDGGTGGDGGTRPDGGFPDNGGGGGCCDARGDLGGASTSLLVGALVAWRTRRRRGTKA
jgi:exopolysaccharide biosynthesis protein